MLSNLRNRKEKGFTIIEVLIVLAIAGLILLVVFLAVPALQRNARNTSRTEDVASILGGISEYVNNNNGTLPSTVSVSGNTLTIGASTANEVPVKLGYYTNVTIGAYSASSANPEDEGRVVLVTSAECDETTIGQPASSSSARSIVALYTLEPDSLQCKES